MALTLVSPLHPSSPAAREDIRRAPSLVSLVYDELVSGGGGLIREGEWVGVARGVSPSFVS